MSPTLTVDRRTGQTDPPVADQRPHRHHRRVVLIAGVVVVVGLVAAWAILFSSLFAADTVQVSGARRLSRDTVRSAAQVPLGVPLARQDLGAIARRTAQLPQVESVSVSRSWPHGIVVQVTERQPVLGVEQPTGWLLVDRHGVGFETLSTLPTGVLQANVDPTDSALLTEVGTVAAALPKSLRSDVRHLDARGRDNLQLTLGSGVVVTWGSSAQSSLKAELLATLLTGKPKPRVSVDVSSPHDPAVR
ncbi:MAG: FtsQ-type protein [Friedmanniella sp.]|nr:FtsQ-type protein [Friedmanniella sp.]